MKNQEYEKSRLFELLEKMPTDETGTLYEDTKYCEWKQKVEDEINDILEFYEDSVRDEIDELKENLKKLNNTLSRHKHLPTGEAVDEL